MSKSSSSQPTLVRHQIFINSFVNTCLYEFDANAEFDHNANKLKLFLLTAPLGNSAFHQSEFWQDKQDERRLNFYLQNLDAIEAGLKNKISELGEEKFNPVIDETFKILNEVKNSEHRSLNHSFILYEQEDGTKNKISLSVRRDGRDSCYYGRVRQGQYSLGNKNLRSSAYISEGEGTEITLGFGKYEGEWVNGERSGMGIYTFENGDKYAGRFEDGVKSGEGSFIAKDGAVMKGEWVDDSMEGRFSILSPHASQRFAFYHENEELAEELTIDETPSDVVRNSETKQDHFVSSFVNFCMETFKNEPNALTAILLLAPLKGRNDINGCIVWESMEEQATSAEDQLKLYLDHLEAIEEKLIDRIAAQEDTDDEQKKNFTSDIREAFEVLRKIRSNNPQITDERILYEDEAGRKMISIYKDGCYYGEAKEIGNITGSGTKITKEGKYVGGWLNGEYHGEGKYTYANGYEYAGRFQNHKFHGEGVLFRDGETYVGSFAEGVKHGVGMGKIFLRDQTVMEGRWLNDKKQGLFKITFPDGSEKSSYYVDDEFLRDETDVIRPSQATKNPAAGRLVTEKQAHL